LHFHPTSASMNSPSILHLVNQPIKELRAMIMAHVSQSGRPAVLGPTLDRLLKSGSGRSLVTLALTSDFLRMMVSCILADRTLTASEVQYSYPFLGPASGLFAKYREGYKEYSGLNKAFIGDFLKFYANDSSLLGLKCRYTRWAGIQIVNNVAANCDDPAPRDFAENAYLAFGTSLKHAAGGGPEIGSVLENIASQFQPNGPATSSEQADPDIADTEFDFDLGGLSAEEETADDEELGFDLDDSSSVEDENLDFDLADFDVSDDDSTPS